MTLHPGARLGSYEVVALIGTGGMGEVYRATDSNLRRSVAIKVLPDAFAQDGERLARFEREAGILAALHHPNIAQIHAFERAEAATALVMELVEGPTLADRIADGPVPPDEALPIAMQIAEALEAAHEQDIIHRDLKPANIKVRADGVVKVLDFGLAKAADPAAGSGDAAQSPTITSPAMTRAGVILGTASYMSPEQARGLVVDRGADIWAWGCVLFEMLAGKRPFAGTDTTEVIAAIVRGEPDWSLLPAGTPEGVRRVLRRCLEKDRKRRFADIRDARFALADAQIEPASAPVPAAASFRRERLAWAATLVVCAAGAAALLWRARGESTADVFPEMRVEITTPPTTDLVSMAISPDGEKLVFVASSDGRPMLWLRSLVTGEVRPLAGTDGASFPFWKPDSRSIGFFTNRRVYRIGVDGGGLKPLASVPVSAGGTWGPNGDILFTLVPDGPIYRVSEDGGESTLVPGFVQGQPGNVFPQFLPDGRRYLYYVFRPDVRGVYLGTLDGPQRQHLFDADAAAVFVPPAQLLFVRAGTLYSQRTNPATLQFEGDPVRVAEGLAMDFAAAAVSASADGIVAYRTGSANRLRQLMWVDRSGKPIGDAFSPDPGNLLSPSLAPNGRQLAGNRNSGGSADIWLLDLERPGAFTRVTTAQGPEIAPIWSPTGDRLVYAKFGIGGFDLWESLPTSGAIGALLFTGPVAEVPLDWSPDGRFLLYRSQAGSPKPRVDLWALPLDGDRTPIPVATTDADEPTGAFSPDGKWLAIESDMSGTAEIYLQRFPGPSVKVPASPGGGISPTWEPGGREIYYITPNGQLMAVSLDFDPGGGVKASPPRKLFTTRVGSGGASTREYMISPDGKRFLMNTLVEQTGSPITLILRPTSTSSPERAAR
jgi:eukaryotic-like serine/threonine-protein kinase